MLLKITHRTEYAYDAPVAYALQRLRLTPRSNAMQEIEEWGLEIDGAAREVGFIDHFGNETQLVSVLEQSRAITVTATGTVRTNDTAGIFGLHTGYAPLWLFAQPTELTTMGPLASAMVERVSGGSDLERLHDLVRLIGSEVAYTVGATGSATSAEQALEQRQGVCQDHAHIFLAFARALGFPARYVSGYLLMDGLSEQVASHAWAEAHVAGLGWVGFDVSNAISPDERYVRLAVGRDYRDAAPTSGIRLGSGEERLAVHITVEQ